MYLGSEFELNIRLGQVVGFNWVTFMYSTGMPITFIISAFNFLILYWIDKWFILRFNRTPKNIDEKVINHVIYSLKYAFVFQFIIGIFMISNDSILTSK